MIPLEANCQSKFRIINLEDDIRNKYGIVHRIASFARPLRVKEQRLSLSIFYHVPVSGEIVNFVTYFVSAISFWFFQFFLIRNFL